MKILDFGLWIYAAPTGLAGVSYIFPGLPLG
jgi:hypothetical protein